MTQYTILRNGSQETRELFYSLEDAVKRFEKLTRLFKHTQFSLVATPIPENEIVEARKLAKYLIATSEQ